MHRQVYDFRDNTPTSRTQHRKRAPMEQPRQTTARSLNSLALFRFVFRLALLSAFAAMSSQGFGKGFAALLALSAVFCVVTGALRGEPILGPVLTHWDEAAAYALLSRLGAALS